MGEGSLLCKVLKMNEKIEFIDIATTMLDDGRKIRVLPLAQHR